MSRRVRLLFVVLCAVLTILGASGVPRVRAESETAAPAPQPKVLYLTFDDGPSQHTQAVLDVLARHNAKATFFVLGRQANGRGDLLHAMYAAGHGVASHTYNHPSLPSVSRQRFDSEVADTAAVLGDLDHGCLRPPYGALNKAVRAEAAEQGYQLIMWTIDPRDWARPGAAAIAQRVIGRAHDGGIVVMHDGGGDRSQTVAALDTILTELAAQGYQFAALCRDGAPGKPVALPNVQLAQAPAPDLVGELPGDSAPAPAEDTPATEIAPPVVLSQGAIFEPTLDAEVSGVVAIVGQANHPTFRKWQLDLLIDGSSETFLALGDTPVLDPAELLAWDTRLYPNGDHVLRLRVVYEGANYDEFSVPVKVRN
jgi:peptidoglycan/xylan/chitin deacetylase (PgdA/CDA1 family)